MIYLYLDASFRRLFKQKYSPADLMHGPISKSDHSVGVTYVDCAYSSGIIALNSQMSLCIRTGITTCRLRAYCNVVVRVVQGPTHPWPSAFSSKMLSKSPDAELPPTNITPFPSGEGAIALNLIP